uniref:ABC transporter permease n=1 Tax=Eubacterium cellulosolvens TaxID=29322 RepID=UPI00048720D6|nr:ABC transporter permease [[Eubacterium] cellulosolvens]
MKNPMNRRFLRELKSDFGKYLVIFLFIVMVVSVVSSFLVANAGVAKAYEKNMVENRVENGHLAFNVKPEDGLLKAVEKKAKVELFETAFFEERRGKETFRMYRLGSEVNKPWLTQGRLPETTGEVALDNLHYSNAEMKVGERITLNGRELTVTGFVALPNYSSLFKDNADLMFDMENFGVGVMAPDGFDDFSSDHVTFGYAWRYKEAPVTDREKKEAAEKLLDAFREELISVNTDITQRTAQGEEGLTPVEMTDYLPDYENKAINFAGEDMSGDGASMEAFLYIVVAVLAFIVAVTTLNTLSKEASVIGTLRASGYTRGELVRHYLILPLFAFLAGMVVGNALGYTTMRDLMMKIYRSMYSLGEVETFWNKEAFLKTTLIPTAIMIAINVCILIRKLRIGPLQFLRREISAKGKMRALRLPYRIPFTARFRLRIILQNLPNYITMAVGIIMAGSIIIFGLMFQPLLTEVSKRIRDTSISQYQYVLKMPEEAEEASAERFAMTSLETQKADYKTDEISVYGIVDDSRYVKKEIPQGKILVSNGYMEKYRLKDGDPVDLYDKYADRTYTFTVAGEYPYEATLAVFLNLDEFNEIFEREPEDYSGYFADEKLRSLTESNIYMVLDSTTFSAYADQLWQSFADLMGPVEWFGIIMFVLMVYLLAKQIIERNAVSISMAKILGFSAGEIGGLYIVSTTIVVVASLLLAVPVVDWLLRLIFRYYLYQRMSGYLPYCISSDCYVKMVLLGIVSYAAVAVMQLLKIRKIKKSDALKNMD